MTELKLLSLPRPIKRLVIIASDLIILSLSFWIALNLGQNFSHLFFNLEELALLLGTLTLSIPVFIRLGLYRAIVRFMGIEAAYAVIKAMLFSTTILALLSIMGKVELSLPVPLIFLAIGLLLLGGTRFAVRLWYRHATQKQHDPLAIYGAGNSGTQLLIALQNSGQYNPVILLDDDSSLQGLLIHGVKVHKPAELPKLAVSHNIKHLALAMPSESRIRRKEIIDSLETLPIRIMSVPNLADLVKNNSKIAEFRDIEIEDLLGREPVQPNKELMQACIANKVVMVTGAGGSIGSELCRQIIQLQPSHLLLFEQNEHSLYQLSRELTHTHNVENSTVRLIPLLGNTLEKNCLNATIKAFNVQTIYHAAAYKHVPMVEHNIIEGVRNNVFGTLYVAQAAVEANVETFILVSTDKAVRPTNVMGASKRLSELVLQGLAQQENNTCFCMVRFGNVLGSSGSVVPLFREQIAKGGPITVTHPQIIRYFMTIPEAAQLVLQTGALATGGDVFVLDMGKPVKIADLARKMVHLMGLTLRDQNSPNGDIDIQFTGLRAGEKLFEELLIDCGVNHTQHPRIMRAQEHALPWPNLETLLNQLRNAIDEHDAQKVRDLLLSSDLNYQPKNTELSDLIYCQASEKIKQLANSSDAVIELFSEQPNRKEQVG